MANKQRKLAFQKAIDSIFGRAVCFLIYFGRTFKKRQEFPGEIKTISIVKLSGIGDAVLTLPMAKKLKEKNKKAKIRVICGKDNRAVFEGLNFIDEIEVINISSKNIFKIISELRKISKDKTDYGIDTGQSSFFSTIVNRLSSGRISGFYNKGMGFFRNSIIDDKIENIEKEHVIFNFLNLAKKIGVKYERSEISLIKPKFSKENAEKVNKMIKEKQVIGIHPCNVFDYREWPKENFVKIMNYLAKNYKYKIVLVGSPDEKEKTEHIIEMLDAESRKKVVNLCGKTSIKEFIALCIKFKIFIANDGGLMHIAAAMNVPTIGIFGYETPVRYAPFNKKSCSLYAAKGCRQCNRPQDYSFKKCYNPVCLKSIKPSEVTGKINQILK